MGTGGPFPEATVRRGSDGDHSPHQLPRYRMSRSYTSSIPSASVACTWTALYLAKSVELSHNWEDDCSTVGQEIPLHLWKQNGSLSCLQYLTSCPYPTTDEWFYKIFFKYYISPTVRRSKPPFPWSFPTIILNIFLISIFHATCHSHLSFLGLMTLITRGK
jgi:hypothetical protein